MQLKIQYVPRTKNSPYLSLLWESDETPAKILWGKCRVLAKLGKAAIIYVTSVRLSVCLSVRIERLYSHWTDFREMWYFNIFRKSVEKVKVSIKPQEWRILYMNIDICLWSYLAHFFLEWEMFWTNIVEKITHKKKKNILCSITFFFFSKIAPFMRFRGKSIVQPYRQ